MNLYYSFGGKNINFIKENHDHLKKKDNREHTCPLLPLNQDSNLMTLCIAAYPRVVRAR
ncbi:hypothetical protein BVRB_5g117330 [Beta vulgaris subsp. vulgaris]|nr:hypothetical protein BVRB_5g117330 [Beta vulgaris subsp. vulgaris]